MAVERVSEEQIKALMLTEMRVQTQLLYVLASGIADLPQVPASFKDRIAKVEEFHKSQFDAAQKN